jgi:hypothetical protein
VKICPACSHEYPAERTHCERDGVGLVALATGAGGRAEDLIGRTVDGRYKVEAIIGKGGMGTVYACRHVVVGKPFAMKVLRAGLEQTEGVLQRFIREAQTANSVRSRHIVEMTDFGQLPSGQFYVTMDLLEGRDLGKALKQGLSPAELFHVFIQVAEVLEQTHQHGIIHRDLKPDNIFLVEEDDDPLFVKLLDFGIAKALHTGPSGLTETGVILGTPYYMSPEQARGSELDHRTDIYSLGVIMYRAYTGKLPFVADTAMGVITRHLLEQPELPSRVCGVDPQTERVILCCLEKRPADRFESMRAVADALRAIRGSGRPLGSVQDPHVAHERSGPNPQVQPLGRSGAGPAHGYLLANPASGSYAHALVAPSGPYPQAMSAASGAYPQVMSAASGAYPRVSGAGPGAGGSGPAPTGAYGAAAPGVHHGGQPVYAGAVASPVAPTAEWTAAHGLATSHAMRLPPAKRRWPIIVGAAAMLGIGGGIAVTVSSLAHSPDLDGAAIAAGSGTAAGSANATPTAAIPATGAPATTEAPSATASPAATAGATPTTAATGAPSTLATAAAAASAAAASATPVSKPVGTPARPGAIASPKGTASSAATTKPRPSEIRSPFDD